MRKQNVDIDHLEIRLRGVAPEMASSAVREFGKALLEQLSTMGDVRPKRIDQIDSGTLQIAGAKTSGELGGRMAKQVAASIRSKL